MANDLSAAHIATQQEKLDAIFGITGGKSVDEFLDGLSLETDKIEDAMLSIDNAVQQQVESLDSYQVQISSGSSDVMLQMSSMEHSLKEIEGMIDLSKNVLKHVADSILATPLIDSEAVQAYSKLMESIHVNIGEFISVYRDRLSFMNKVKFAMFQQQQKKEMMMLKHQLDIEKMRMKDGPIVDGGDSSETQEWDADKIIKMLKKHDLD